MCLCAVLQSDVITLQWGQQMTSSRAHRDLASIAGSSSRRRACPAIKSSWWRQHTTDEWEWVAVWHVTTTSAALLTSLRYWTGNVRDAETAACPYLTRRCRDCSHASLTWWLTWKLSTSVSTVSKLRFYTVSLPDQVVHFELKDCIKKEFIQNSCKTTAKVTKLLAYINLASRCIYNCQDEGI